MITGKLEAAGDKEFSQVNNRSTNRGETGKAEGGPSPRPGAVKVTKSEPRNSERFKIYASRPCERAYRSREGYGHRQGVNLERRLTLR